MSETIKYNNEIILKVKNPDGGILKRKDLINLHEPVEELIFHEIMLNNDIKRYINLGVNGGYYSILAKKISPNTEIIGFEGQKIFKNTFEENVKLNGFDPKEFNINYQFLSTDSYQKKSDNTIIRLSEFLLNYDIVDFISSDIQGAETKVLKDLLENNQLKKVKTFLIGTHDYSHGRNGEFVNSHIPCLNILINNGYKIIYQCEPRKVWLQPDGIIWAERK